jgi:hypothetical protein
MVVATIGQVAGGSGGVETAAEAVGRGGGGNDHGTAAEVAIGRMQVAAVKAFAELLVGGMPPRSPHHSKDQGSSSSTTGGSGDDGDRAMAMAMAPAVALALAPAMALAIEGPHPRSPMARRRTLCPCPPC